MKKPTLLLTNLTLGAILAFVACCASIQMAFADEPAIQESMTSYIEAFNKHDAQAAADYWTPKCVHIDRETDLRTEGREAIMTDLQAVFDSTPDAQLSGSLKSVHIVQPTVASIEGETMLSGGDQPPSMSMFTAIVVLEGGKWRLDRVDESPLAVASTSSEALRQLEWLIGSWKDESDAAVVETNCRWSPNEAFLLRSYSVAIGDEDVSQGTQVIGWDANQQSIRSWNFDSSGGFGEATWSRSGNEWLVRSKQTSAQGSLKTGTYVIKPLDADAMEVHLIGQDADGIPLPNETPIRVVRVPAEPAATEVPK